MDNRIKKMRERLIKHRRKITELETQAAEMEQEIKKAEEEQLGYLARSAANSLSGGMEEIFELLRGLHSKPDKETAANETERPPRHELHQNSDEKKEGETADDTLETDNADESEV